MSTRTRRLLSAAVVFVTVTLLSTHTAAQRDAGVAASRVIVVFRNATLPADADARVNRAGGTVVARLNAVGVLVAAPASDAQAAFRQSVAFRLRRACRRFRPRDRVSLDRRRSRARTSRSPSRRPAAPVPVRGTPGRLFLYVDDTGMGSEARGRAGRRYSRRRRRCLGRDTGRGHSDRHPRHGRESCASGPRAESGVQRGIDLRHSGCVRHAEL